MNKVKRRKKVLSVTLCMMLIVAMALSAAGCSGSTSNTDSKGGTAKDRLSGAEAEGNAQTEGKVLGEGSKVFMFTVVDQEGSKTQFEIHTDKETVGEALMELELITGKEGGYGLYVETVNGITADYDKDGVYWAFYVNDEYAQAGVDSTRIAEGESYSFKVE